MEGLERRLKEARYSSYEFVEQECEAKHLEALVHVKTLIWKVTVNETKDCLISTALQYHDRVDENKLRDELMHNQDILQLMASQLTLFPTEHQETKLKVTNIQMAETVEAEDVTGYMSGTIPLLGHDQPLILIMDGGLSLADEATIMSTGSGSFRHSLWLSPSNLMKYATQMTAGMFVAPITICPKQSDIFGTNNNVASNSSREQQSSICRNKNYADCSSSSSLLSDDMDVMSRVLRDACLRPGNADMIQSVIARSGERFRELFHDGAEVNCSRNPFHLVVWKGDIESIQLLLDAARRFEGLDLVNSISTGEHNYGKTPIFYAINQKRDDVVKLLLQEGASMLIVNRNGNTPCSIAPGHVSMETFALLQQKEREQLDAGGTFKNYATASMLDETLRTDKNMHHFDNNGESISCKDYETDIHEAKCAARQSIKSLSKKLRDAAGKKGQAEIVRDIIAQSGDAFPKLVQVGTEGNFTKNALHLAAWKGDSEAIEHLIDAGWKYGLDLTNTISKGAGNYGKTPIFYAITQDRDDIVKLLLERGANLLVVNNKGQTPCSMSITHLQSETCQLLFEREYQQIQAGGEFVNYRLTHNDKKQYGDLDPRFEIDEINHDDDIEVALETFRAAIQAINASGSNMPAYKVLPAYFEPRSLRPTTRELRRSRADRFRSKQSICADKMEQSNLPASRVVLKEAAHEEKKEMDLPASLSDFKPQPPKKSQKNEEGVVVKASLPDLHLRDLIIQDETLNSRSLQAIVIDDMLGFASLAEEVALTLALVDKKREQLSSSDFERDVALTELSWGLDCEWKPSRDRGREFPVATLQLSTLRRTFVLDLQTLCQSLIKDPHTATTDTESALSDTLEPIFSNPNVPIVGFGIGQDIAKLAVSFPHIPCFVSLDAVINLDVFFYNSFPRSLRHNLKSLQDAVCYFMQKRLDKTEQCSNWQQRPLLPSQIEYACLDAAVLPRLLKEALSQFHVNSQSQSSFFSKHPHLLTSWRISFLDQGHLESSLSPQTAYNIGNGTIKQLLSLFYARQTWQTGKEPPPLTKVPLEHQLLEQEMRLEKEARKVELKQQRAKELRQAKQKRQSLSLATLAAETRPSPGQFAGYTKETCIQEILGNPTVDLLQRSAFLAFNRRGGIVEMKNCWLLFVNFGATVQNQKFRNKFSNGSKFMTFTVDPRKSLDGRMYDHVSGAQQLQGAGNKHRLLLFARPAGNSEYLYCGECLCVGEDANEAGGINLLLQLLDYELLVGSPAFLEMVSCIN